MSLWLQRHAQVVCEPGLCYGRTDVPACPQATQRAAQTLAQILPRGVALWTSPLSRCTDLAQALRALRPDLQALRLDARLAEMDFGSWEGQPWSRIARADFDAWTADFGAARAGGTGESTDHFLQRVNQAREDWQCSRSDAVWITHAGVMRALQLLQQGVHRVENAAQWPAAPIAYGELLKY